MTDHLPRPTAQVEPYVEALGIDGAIEFLLAFGGAEIYITAHPKSRGQVTQVVGRRGAARLAEISHRLPRRVPLAKRWIAAVLFAKGLSKADIARKLHMTEVTIRSWLNKAPGPSGETGKDQGGPTQLSLF